MQWYLFWKKQAWRQRLNVFVQHSVLYLSTYAGKSPKIYGLKFVPCSKIMDNTESLYWVNVLYHVSLCSVTEQNIHHICVASAVTTCAVSWTHIVDLEVKSAFVNRGCSLLATCFHQNRMNLGMDLDGSEICSLGWWIQASKLICFVNWTPFLHLVHLLTDTSHFVVRIIYACLVIMF